MRLFGLSSWCVRLLRPQKGRQSREKRLVSAHCGDATEVFFACGGLAFNFTSSVIVPFFT